MSLPTRTHVNVSQLPAAADAEITLLAGTPGYLMSWTKNLISAAGAAFGVAVEFHDEVPSSFTANPARQTIVRSEAPSARLRKALSRGHARAVVVIGDPALDLAFQQHILGQPKFEALQALTCAAAQVADLPKGRFTAVRPSARPARAVVVGLLQGLGWPTSGAAFDNVLAEFTGPHPEQPFQGAVEWYLGNHFPGLRQAFKDGAAESDKAVQGAVSPLYAIAAGQEARDIVWNRQLFFDGDQPGTPAAPWIEVAGGARILFYGPYLHLPRGRWAISTKLAFSDDLDQTVFSIEVVCRDPLARGRVKPTRAGMFAANFAFDHTESGHPVEVRISSDYGSIFGRMALLDVTFQPDYSTR